jgi:hypothetical protein
VTGEELVRLMEAQAEERIRHERKLNQFLGTRCCRPAQETERYARGPLCPSDPSFYTRLDYLNYLGKREMGRFNPTVKYPAPEKKR